jgi:ribokinase
MHQEERMTAHERLRQAPGTVADVHVLAVGLLYLDVLYGPLDQAPRLGEEIHTPRVTVQPGGIANFADAATGLGASATVSAHVGEGPLSRLAASLLDEHGIDTTALEVLPGWELPITSALAYDGDRAMVTGEKPEPPHGPLHPDTSGADVVAAHLTLSEMPWLKTCAAPVVADVGWDETGLWDRGILRHLEHCEAFVPNDGEACAYTRTTTPREAARALSAQVPLVVVTCGGDGAIGIDSRTGQEIQVPALDLGPVDTTGAGDTFEASFCLAIALGWPLGDAVEFSSLTATARAAGVSGHARTPDPATLASLAREHRLRVADRLEALAGPATGAAPATGTAAATDPDTAGGTGTAVDADADRAP